MGWLSDVGGLVSAGVGIYDAFSGGDGDAEDALKEQQRSLEQARGLADAIADPTSKRFQNLVSQEREAANQAFIQGIDRMLVEHARQKAKGGPGILLSDRRDEALASAVGRQRELGDIEARKAARDTLAQAAQATGIGLSAGPATVQLAQNIEAGDRNRRAGGFSTLR